MTYYESCLRCSKCGTDNKNTKLTWVNQFSGRGNDCSVITLRCAGWCNSLLISYGVWCHVESQKEAINSLPRVLRVI